MSTPAETGAVYGLTRPVMADAEAALRRVHGENGPSVWAQLLRTAGLTGTESGEPALQQILEAMSQADPVSHLCAHALRIRLGSHTYLAAAHALTRSPT